METIFRIAGLTMNFNKTECFNQQIANTLNINCVTNMKYLGVWLNKSKGATQAKFKKQIKEDFSKCLRKCSMIRLLTDLESRSFCFRAHVVSRFRYVFQSETNLARRIALKKYMLFMAARTLQIKLTASYERIELCLYGAPSLTKKARAIGNDRSYKLKCKWNEDTEVIKARKKIGRVINYNLLVP